MDTDECTGWMVLSVCIRVHPWFNFPQAAPQAWLCSVRTARSFHVEEAPRPSGKIIFPDGNAAYPHGKVIFPNGNAAYPHGNAAFPNGKVAYTNGKMIRTKGNMACATTRPLTTGR